MIRIGNGWDSHRLMPGRKLILAGVDIPFAKGLLGHSDGDVLAHAIMDALLGAAHLPDIGRLFPDNDPAYLGANSMHLLSQVWTMVEKAGYGLLNLDVVIKAEQPKLSPYLALMTEQLASKLCCQQEQISLKAKTAEGLDAVGRGEAMEAWAVALLEKKTP